MIQFLTTKNWQISGFILVFSKCQIQTLIIEIIIEF